MRDEHDGPVPGLDRLRRDLEPPPGVRARTVDALISHGLIDQRRVARRRPRRWLQAAAAVILFVAGVVAGRALGAGVDTQPSFMLLVYGTPGGGAQERDRVAEYTAWARDRANRVVRADRLGDAIFQAGVASAAQPSGFFLLAAADEAAAIAIARSHPHARAGGTLALHRIR